MAYRVWKTWGDGVIDRYTRRVQMTGGSTFVVSLPSEWAKSVGLKPKQELLLVPQGDLSLLILVGARGSELGEALVDAAQCQDDSDALRGFIANYIAGYDIIKIRCDIGSFRHGLKTQIRDKLIGVEIVEETSDYIVTQCLHGDADLPLERALRRMALLVTNMLRDSVDSLLRLDHRFAEEVIARDDEVDRFAYYIFRQLNRSLINPVLIRNMGMDNIREFIPFTILVRSVERIADHATKIASCVRELGDRVLPRDLMTQIKSLADTSLSLFEDAMRSVYTLDPVKANDVIRHINVALKIEADAVQTLFGSHLDAKKASSLRLVLESLRRIAEYSVDICEVVVDVSVSSSMKFKDGVEAKTSG
jgi:phosphate uptake regulator